MWSSECEQVWNINIRQNRNGMVEVLIDQDKSYGAMRRWINEHSNNEELISICGFQMAV